MTKKANPKKFKDLDKVKITSFEKQLREFNRKNKGLSESTIKKKFSKQFRNYKQTEVKSTEENRIDQTLVNTGLTKKHFYELRNKASKALSKNKGYVYKKYSDIIEAEQNLDFLGVLASDALNYDETLEYTGGLIVLEFLCDGQHKEFLTVPLNRNELKEPETVKYKIENWREFVSIRSKHSDKILNDAVLVSIDLRLYFPDTAPRKKEPKKKVYKQVIK